MIDNREKARTFHWTRQRYEAARLVAEDELTNREIAQKVGCGASTLSSWKARSEFMAQVGDYIGDLQAGMLRLAIAKKRERVKVLDAMQAKLLTVVQERAEDMAGEVAGGSTGLMTRQVKQIGTGDRAMTITEYSVDAGVVREIRGLQEQAAKELGQWVERTATEDLTRIVEIVGVPADAI